MTNEEYEKYLALLKAKEELLEFQKKQLKSSFINDQERDNNLINCKDKLALLEAKKELLEIQKRQLEDSFINDQAKDSNLINCKEKSIKTYWKAYDFNQSGMWEGKILVDEDGWFEGIVTNPDITFYKNNGRWKPATVRNDKEGYHGESLIYGILIENKLIELLKISPIDVSEPFSFRTVFNPKKVEIHKNYFNTANNLRFNNGIYSGNFYIESVYSNSSKENHIRIGDCATETKNLNLDLAEKLALIRKIERFKEQDIYIDTYKKVKKIKIELAKKLAEIYEYDNRYNSWKRLEIPAVFTYDEKNGIKFQTLKEYFEETGEFNFYEDYVEKHAIYYFYKEGYEYDESLISRIEEARNKKKEKTLL